MPATLDPNRVVRDWQRPVYNLALRRLGNEADAADACQEVFIKVLTHLHQLRSSERLKPWVYRIAHNTISGLQGRAGRRRQVESAAPSAAIKDSEVEALEQRSRIQAALAGLSEDHRAVIELHYLQELSQREVGAVLELSQSAVHARLKRGLERLRISLGGSMALLAPDWVAVPRSLSRELAALPRLEAPLLAAAPASTSLKTTAFAASLAALALAGGLAALQAPADSAPRERPRPRRRAALPRKASLADRRGPPLPEEPARPSAPETKAEVSLAADQGALALRRSKGQAAFDRDLRAWLRNEAMTRDIRAWLRDLGYQQSVFLFRHRRFARRGELPVFQEDPPGYRISMAPIQVEGAPRWWAAADPQPGFGLRFFYISEAGQLISSRTEPIRPDGLDTAKPGRGEATPFDDLLAEQRADLDRLLEEPDRFAEAAEGLLASPGDALREPLLRLLCQLRRPRFTIALPLRQVINRALVRELENPETPLKVGLLYGLVLDEDPEAGERVLPRMVELAASQDISLSLAALESIGAIRSDESARVLRRIAADTSRRVMTRRLALVSYDPKREDCLAFAARFKSDPEPLIRAMAWRLITSALPHKRALPMGVLDDFFAEPSSKIRWRIGQALRAGGDLVLADLLEARAAGADPERRAEARSIVEDLRRAHR